MSADITVGQNRPRLLAPGTPPPAAATSPAAAAAVDQLAPGPYWTADKAARVMAEGGRSLSKLYGPDFKLSSVEVDLVGQPLANVLNDWVALPSGPQGDRMANLLALLAVVGLLVAFRLPDVLEAHDLLPRWAWLSRQRERTRPRAPADERPLPREEGPGRRPPAGPVEPEPGPAANGSGDRWRRFEATTVGGGQLQPREASPA